MKDTFKVYTDGTIWILDPSRAMLIDYRVDPMEKKKIKYKTKIWTV